MEKERFWITKNICLIALFAVVLFVQEQILSFLPNIQLTVFLIILYSKLLGFRKTSVIVVIYFALDCLVNGSFNLIFIGFQLLGWLIMPLLMCTVFKKVTNNIALAFISILFSLLYSWIMIYPSCLVYGYELIACFIADLPFEALLAGSSFVSTLLLFNPVYGTILKILPEKENENKTAQ